MPNRARQPVPMKIDCLGPARFPSPIRRTINNEERIPARIVRRPGTSLDDEPGFEIAGPRDRLFFDPARTRAGVVTCGGLCPGLNDVIRSLFLELHHVYGVNEVLGFRWGYTGLDPQRGRNRSF
jgi:6-phosphofructokinase 1